MIPMVLYAAAFVVRAVVGAAFPGPAYPDSYYYVHVARQLAAGDGFIAHYIWNLDDAGRSLLAAPELPIPSNAVWMPLAELIQVPFIWLLGPNDLAAGLPFWLVGALASPLAWWIGRDAGFGRLPAIAAAILVAVPGGLTPFMSQPDNFGPFMTLGALSLWLCARGMRGDRRAFVLGGLVVGLATLARSDGVLLGLPFAIVGVRELLRGPRSVGLAAVLGCAALFVLTVSPWLFRQLEVFGSIVPSASSGRMLWLTDYQQFFSISSPPTPDAWWAQGLGGLVQSRVGGLLSALGLFALLPLVAVLVPFAVLGAWAHRSNAAFRPFFIYGVALLGAMALLFPVLVPHGTFIHSAVALVPHTFLLVIAGVGVATRWAARRLPAWNAPRAVNVFIGSAVAVTALAAALQTSATIGRWSEVRTAEERLAGALRATPSSDRVMSPNPGAYNHLAGNPGIVTPNDPLPVVEDVLRAYDVRWLVLERRSLMPALAPVLAGDVRPAWLSGPLAVLPEGSSTAVAGSPPLDGPRLAGAVYAVCLSGGDARCP